MSRWISAAENLIGVSLPSAGNWLRRTGRGVAFRPRRQRLMSGDGEKDQASIYKVTCRYQAS
jgi:hypothetical protein